MPTHRGIRYEQTQVPYEYECPGDCSEHGPFPTEWVVASGQRYTDLAQVEWERYVAPFKVETRTTKAPKPEV